MAFNPERLALVVEPIGGVGLRWFNYQTDETEADLTTADYLPDAEKYGLRAYDLFFVSPASGVEEPYILVVDSIDADGNATLVKAKDELDREITKTDAQYDKEGSLYAPDTYALDVATKLLGTPAGPRAAGKSLLHLEVVDEGSGTATSPSTTGLALTAAVFKEGWPNSTAADGEIDTARFTYRQVNGDVCAILGNGAVINGFSAFFEAQILSLEPVTFATKHSIQLHAGSINDRDGGQWGYDCAKMVGQGGTAFYGYSATTAGWDYGLQLYHKEKAQLEQIAANAALRIYQFNTPATYYDMKAVSTGFQVTDNAGAIVHPVGPASVNYTPTVTDAAAGAPTTATITGRWKQTSDKVRQVSIRAVMTDIGTLTNAWRFSLPAAASTDARYFTYWTGINLATGALLRCWVYANTDYITVTAADGASAPGTSGQNIQFSVEYETV